LRTRESFPEAGSRHIQVVRLPGDSSQIAEGKAHTVLITYLPEDR
jgi:hypothetical protein